MKGEDRIIELLTEQLGRQDTLIEEVRELKIQQQQTNQRLDRLEQQQAQTNLAIGELRLSVMRLAEAVERLNGLEHRVDAIEQQLRRAS
ncbi:hypothetical protein [Hymenobacter weizhouensis]|uniref:hypothetical protein n=1 Tax=Hymenobacter sp. YIM 151500-1 TaxID=2987689 RepID=UPI002227A4BA|nr:hypothetical protein [Hymenobacter sp. YIM 151500-1]UYZ64460.1 hypothetical protein OIS53_06310 [Hymenobacter sp. YIM 151500-1]